MRPFPFSDATRTLIRLALDEDLYAGDVTTDAIFGPDETSWAEYRAKEPMTLAGLPVVQEVFRLIDAEVVVHWQVEDGDTVTPEGAPVPLGRVEGRVRSILRGERVSLNFFRHLSGIATRTHAWSSLLSGTRTRLVDTRKTTPGFRELEKYAVRMGGGFNHRYNLSSGVMIKDNHIKAAGSIAAAVERVRHHAPFLLRIEVETANLDEVQQALAAGADVIMLDNMTTAQMAEAVAVIAGRALVEASGNITDARLGELRDIGIDIISSGAITHSAPQVDISLKIV
jgi:nicotinate-nucleotide pyrophosphorylase (carboxylating)